MRPRGGSRWLAGEFVLAVAVSLVPVVAVGELNGSTYAAGLLLAAALLLPTEAYRQFWLRRDAGAEAVEAATEEAAAVRDQKAEADANKLRALSDEVAGLAGQLRERDAALQDAIARIAVLESPAPQAQPTADTEKLRHEIEALQAELGLVAGAAARASARAARPFETYGKLGQIELELGGSKLGWKGYSPKPVVGLSPKIEAALLNDLIRRYEPLVRLLPKPSEQLDTPPETQQQEQEPA